MFLLGIWPIQFSRGPYDVLKANGLDLVPNEALRIRIVNVYDQALAKYLDSQEGDRNVVFEVVRPYYLRAFRDIRFRETARPSRYDQLVRNPYFMNVIEYRLRSLEVNAIEAASIAIQKVADLLQEVDAEVVRHQ